MDVGDLSGGNEPTTFVSIRIEAVDEPSFVVVDPAKNVTAERLNAVPRELFTSTPAGAAATARVVNTAGANRYGDRHHLLAVQRVRRQA